VLRGRDTGIVAIRDTFRGNLVGSASLLLGKDTTALFNAKTLQTKDTTALWNAKTLQGKDTTALERVSQRSIAGGYAALPNPLDSTLPLRADGLAARPVGIFYETDFFWNQNANLQQSFPWGMGSIATGTFGNTIHPGVGLIKSSTTTNSGYYCSNSAYGNSLLLAGSEATDLVCRFDTMTASTYYFGFHNASSVTRPTMGCLFIVEGTTARGFNFATTGDSTATTYTLTKLLWYWLNVRINADATWSYFTIRNSVGALVFSDSLGTKMPTAAGQETAHGFVVTNSGTTAYSLMEIDYLNLRIGRKISAGRPN
jgi:hypothetical protein